MTRQCDRCRRRRPYRLVNRGVLPSVVEGYLRTCEDHSGAILSRTRELLAKLLGPITLRRDGDRLVAKMKGTLPALLEMDGEMLYNRGSPNPLRELYNWPAVQAEIS